MSDTPRGLNPAMTVTRMNSSRRDAAIARFAAAHHGHFNAMHLEIMGFSDREREHRLDVGRWLLVHEGVYRIAGVPTTWRGDVLAACWAGGTRASASHRCAAVFHMLPGRVGTMIELTCQRWKRTQHGGLIVHESQALPDRDITFIDGIPVTTVERTIFDLCAVVGPKTIDLAIDSALRRELTTFERLAATSRRVGRRGLKGTRLLRRLLSERDPAHALSESEQERLLVRVLTDHGFAPPVPQYVIRDQRGEFVARVDLAYPSAQIAIEYESYQHHVGKHALVRDSRRRNQIAALGWMVLSATAEDVRYGQGTALASTLRRSLQRRTA